MPIASLELARNLALKKNLFELSLFIQIQFDSVENMEFYPSEKFRENSILGNCFGMY